MATLCLPEPLTVSLTSKLLVDLGGELDRTSPAFVRSSFWVGETAATDASTAKSRSTSAGSGAGSSRLAPPSSEGPASSGSPGASAALLLLPPPGLDSFNTVLSPPGFLEDFASPGAYGCRLSVVMPPGLEAEALTFPCETKGGGERAWRHQLQASAMLLPPSLQAPDYMWAPSHSSVPPPPAQPPLLLADHVEPAAFSRQQPPPPCAPLLAPCMPAGVKLYGPPPLPMAAPTFAPSQCAGTAVVRPSARLLCAPPCVSPKAPPSAPPAGSPTLPVPSVAAQKLLDGPPPVPALGSFEMPTVGSILHSEGQCKPCAFVHSRGCETGLACKFCHLCSKDERKRRKKEDRKGAAAVVVAAHS